MDNSNSGSSRKGDNFTSGNDVPINIGREMSAKDCALVDALN